MGLDWLAWVGGLAGIAALITAVAQAKASRHGTEFSALDEVRKLEKDLRDAKAERDRVKDELGSARRDMALMRRRLDHIEEELPLALIAPRLLDPLSGGTGRVLNSIRDLIAVVSPQQGGRILWVNEAFCNALGMEREDIVDTSWRDLIHPEDRAKTERAEARGWMQDVEGLVNRYRKASGGWVVLRWWASTYRAGVSLAAARVEGALPGEKK